MRIAILADTHDKPPSAIYREISGADEIWHLGDVTGASLIDELRALGPRVSVVRGNCDPGDEWPLAIDREVEGWAVRLVHIPPAVAPAGVQVLLHGHTHVPRNERLGGVRFLNPGCLTRPNRGAPRSYAWLTLERGQEIGWRVVVLG